MRVFSLGGPQTLLEGRFRGNAPMGRASPRKRPSKLKSNLTKEISLLYYTVIPKASEGRFCGNAPIGSALPRKRPSKLQPDLTKEIPLLDQTVIPRASRR